ncbi:unnamed protein product [Darwinula stevensoni]|uniref:Uncharacterized protein n=1 Tax=Darwinula stevensoni TaxID=69355 RepID=A0A7R9FT96_9CRUS|nr:unnamed protein product [Darwinula stevensoni]CAG0904239.1 unnamed protein product [Darwinula stevensoni]
MACLGALLGLLALTLFSAAQTTKESSLGYLLTAPKVLRSNSTELMCLSVANAEGGGRAELTLTGEVANATLATLDHSFAKGTLDSH